jgi:hypothetical protein
MKTYTVHVNIELPELVFEVEASNSAQAIIEAEKAALETTGIDPKYIKVGATYESK